MFSKQLKPSISQINGFTLLESLCALMCALIVFSLCTAVMRTAGSLFTSSPDDIRELGILQMRELAAVFDSCQVHDGILEMENARDTCSLQFHQGRIVRRPGYEIFLENIEDGHFFQDQGIWLEVVQDGRIWKWQILPEKK